MESLSPATPGLSWGAEIWARTPRHHGFSSGENFLHTEMRAALYSRLSNQQKIEFDSLIKEKDPELFREGALVFGGRLEDGGKLDLAAVLYSAIGARQRFDALAGRGSPGLRAEFLLKRFTETATDYRMIVPMLAGTMVGSMAKTAIGVRLAGGTRAAWWSRGMVAKLSSGMGAYLLEVPVFAGSAHLLNGGNRGTFSTQLPSAFLTLGALKLSGLAAPKGFLRHAAPFAGLMGAHQLEEYWGLRAKVDGATTVVDTLGAVLSLGIGANLGHRLLGRNIHSSQYDLEARRVGLSPPFLQTVGQTPPYAWALASRYSPRSIASGDSLAGPSLLKMSSLGDGPRSALQEKFRPQFPPEDRDSYSEEIIFHVLNTPSSLPDFHDKLLAALSQSPLRGSKSQYVIAMNLELVFSSNSLHSPTGSFNYALIQQFVTKAILDPEWGHLALLVLFETMEQGPTRDKLQALYEAYRYGKGLALPLEISFSFDFWKMHINEAMEFLQDYRKEDKILLLNFVHEIAKDHPVRAKRLLEIFGDGKNSGRYDPILIDTVLDEAKFSPVGHLTVQRMLQIFAVADVSAKLKDLLPPDETEDTHRFLAKLQAQGLTKEQMAEKINGSRHAGYVEDPRLAGKIVDVVLETSPFFDSPNRRQEAFDRLEAAFFRFARSREKLTPEVLMELFQTNPNPQAERLSKSLEANRVTLEIHSGPDFDRIVKAWGQAPETEVSLLLREQKPGALFRILIRDLPPMDLTNKIGEWRAFSDLMHRLKALSHEAGHFEDFSNSLELKPQMSRQERHVSEGMALFTEFGFRMQNIDQWFWDQAQRLGDSLGLYFQSISDKAYYGQENENIMRGLRNFIGEED